MEDELAAFDLLNEYAPEHLIIASDDAYRLAEYVRNAGSVFLGNYTPESAGDYASGTNHTLPTNGFAKAYSGVSVDSFIKKISFQHITAQGLQQLGPFIEVMAAAEGLDAHARAVSIRTKSPVSYTHLDVYKRQAYYNIPVEQMAADLEAKKAFVEKFSLTTPERYWHYLHHLFPNNNFLVCALDMAAWDIFGKMQRKPLYKMWNTQTNTAPLTDYTIGIDSIEKMLEKMQEKPWPIYKVKVCLLYTSRCV